MAGFSTLILVFVVGGIIGMRALRDSADDARRYIAAIDRARATQVEVQKQFYLWKSMALSRGDESGYRSNAFLFSFQADRVQDLLFNLKILCGEYPGIPEKIAALRRDHKALTNDYYGRVERLRRSAAALDAGELADAGRRDDAMLNRMDDIVRDIERHADGQIERINGRSYVASVASLGCIAVVAAAMSVFVGRRLMRAHADLDELVRERTRDLVDANKLLREEVEEHRRTEALLERARRDTDESRALIGVSEEKYRRLVEDSRDIVFSLDSERNVMSVNRAVSAHFGVSVNDVIGRSFVDLLWSGGRNRDLSRDLILRKLDSERPEDWPLQFTAEFTSPRFDEGKVMSVRLERVDRNGSWGILGKMTAPPVDELARTLVFERQRYVIGNSILKTDELSFRLTRNLAGLLPEGEIGMLRFALREIMINAIEHGNLNITYAEKTEATAGSSYFDLIVRRRRDARYTSRRLTIEYAVNREHVVYRLTDEGDGFDYRAFLRADPHAANGHMLAHGRGIAIARQVFDELRYVGKGNRVVMVKRLVPTTDVTE